MVFIKRVNNNDQGDSTHWGGDHNDILDKYFDDVDIEGTTGKPAKINTKTEFRDNKLYLWNSGNTFKYNIRPGTLTQDVELSLPTISTNGTLLSTGGANDWTALQTFRNTLLALRNPTNTASYIHNTSAIVANRNITWPLLTADDTIVFNNFGAELQNKTVNIDQNALKHSTTNAEGDILIYDTTSGRYVNLGGGTDGQVLTRVSGDTAWTAGGGSDNIPTVGTRFIGSWNGNSSSGSSGILAGTFAQIAGVVSPVLISDSTGRIGSSYALPASGNFGGFKTATTFFGRPGDPELWVRYAITGADNGYRLFIGFVNDVIANYNADTPDFASRSFFTWQKDAAAANIGVSRNDGDGTADIDTSLVSLSATDASIHTVKLFAEHSNSRFGISLDGAAATYYTTEIPASGTRLGIYVGCEGRNATTKTFHLYGVYFKYTII